MTDNLESLLRRQQAISVEIESQLRLISRFGKDSDYLEGTIFRFRHAFPAPAYVRSGPARIAYMYAAIKADNGFWYLTCSNTFRMNFDELIKFIGDEDCWMIRPTLGKKLKVSE